MNEVTTVSLTPRRDLAAEALACAVDGRCAAAQTLATAMAGGVTEYLLEVSRRKLANAQESTMEQPLWRAREALLMGAMAQAWQHTDGRPEAETPGWYSRHATVHGHGAEQYSMLNALKALMLITGLLRELYEEGKELYRPVA